MPKIERPNILLIHSDQHNPFVTGCYGDAWVQTPNLDALAAAGTFSIGDAAKLLRTRGEAMQSAVQDELQQTPSTQKSAVHSSRRLLCRGLAAPAVHPLAVIHQDSPGLPQGDPGLLGQGDIGIAHIGQKLEYVQWLQIQRELAGFGQGQDVGKENRRVHAEPIDGQRARWEWLVGRPSATLVSEARERLAISASRSTACRRRSWPEP